MVFKQSDNEQEQDFVEPITEGDATDELWLEIVRRGWETGDDWFNSTLRPRIERNLAHYKNRHEPGSKYYREEFKKRSRFFRPKIRTAIRKIAAAGTRAFFSTEDLAHCSPTDEGNPQNVLAAEIHNIILNHRLKNQVPWYKIVVAALTDVSINGVVISRQYWDYEVEEVEEIRARRSEDGLMSAGHEIVRRVKHDRPMSRIVPIENIRISSASDWSDPMQTSPFIIEKRPYYLTDLRKRMQSNSLIPYREGISDAELRQGETYQDDSLRAKREDSRDRYTEASGTGDAYDVVWVRECIVRIDHMDYYFETVGSTMLISDPVPLSRVSRIGRPYVMGYAEIEPHTLSPDGPADLGAGLQRESNELVNSRMDNVKLSMTGRFIVRRGAQTDIASLMRNVPGSITYTQNVNDVRDMRAQDVTQSAYQEQDRLNLDMDDLLGTFSQSTVQSNRAMNETVGGMQMLSDGANEITEFQIRNFTETWYKPVLRQMVELERAHESSRNVLMIAGEEYGQTLAQTFQLIQQPTNVEVDVGFGNLNPIQRIERLSMGLSTMEQFSPGILAKLEQRQVAKEVFGALGFKDGSRFLPHLGNNEEDPRIVQLEEMVQQLQAVIEGKQVEQQGKLQLEQMRGQTQLQLEQMRSQVKTYIEQLRAQIKDVELQIEREDSEINKRQLWMQREALSHTIQMEERRFELEEIRFMREMGIPVGQPAVGEPQIENNALVQQLRNPSSGTPIDSSGRAPIVEMGDDPGVVARGNYGNVPFMEG